MYWLLWVFITTHKLSLILVRRVYSYLPRAGSSVWRLLLLWSTGCRHAGPVLVVYWLSCSIACGTFPDQGLNLCPLRWQVDSNHWTTSEVPAICS